MPDRFVPPSSMYMALSDEVLHQTLRPVVEKPVQPWVNLGFFLNLFLNFNTSTIIDKTMRTATVYNIESGEGGNLVEFYEYKV